MAEKSITYVLVNNLGGITSMIENLILHKPENSFTQDALLLDIAENKNSSILHSFGGGIPVKKFSYSKKENWYDVFRKLSRAIGTKEGVLVTNDVYDMLMLSYYKTKKKVVQIVHDGYNVTLAINHGDVVDAFICHSYFFYEVMCQLMPHRRHDIYFINYGIKITGKKRLPLATGSVLKLVFVGRHDEGKGIFDLITIENILAEKNISTDWLILGKGPQTQQLKEQWQGKDNVIFETPATSAGVLEALSARDVLVFPTKFEGFPVALLEAMSVGCVPVASDLPGGLRELISQGNNGFLCNMDDARAFADKIEWLHENRGQLERMSNLAFENVTQNFNAVVQSRKYHELFEQIAAVPGKPRHHSVKKKLGSRLDQPWLPNIVTKLLRGKAAY